MSHETNITTGTKRGQDQAHGSHAGTHYRRVGTNHSHGLYIPIEGLWWQGEKRS